MLLQNRQRIPLRWSMLQQEAVSSIASLLVCHMRKRQYIHHETLYLPRRPRSPNRCNQVRRPPPLPMPIPRERPIQRLKYPLDSGEPVCHGGSRTEVVRGVRLDGQWTLLLYAEGRLQSGQESSRQMTNERDTGQDKQGRLVVGGPRSIYIHIYICTVKEVRQGWSRLRTETSGLT